MGDGTEQNPYTREDVLRLIKKHGSPEGLDLSGKEFEEGIDLRGFDLRGIIIERAVFKMASKITLIEKGVKLSSIEFWGDPYIGAILSDARLERARLSGAHFQKAHLRSTHLERANLSRAHLEWADLSCAHLEGASLYSAFFERTCLRGAYLQGAGLMGVKLSDSTEMQSVNWGNYILKEENIEEYDYAVDTYRCLKMWYTDAGLYDIAGEFFFREMTSKRKELKWCPNPIPRIWSKFFSLICGYGERPLRVIGWAVSVVLGLALTYFLIGSVWEWSAFWKSLYFSAVSFTALGYGSWLEITNDWIKGIGAFESFVGVFTIALFLVTFTRKMIR